MPVLLSSVCRFDSGLTRGADPLWSLQSKAVNDCLPAPDFPRCKRFIWFERTMTRVIFVAVLKTSQSTACLTAAASIGRLEVVILQARLSSCLG